MEIKKINGERNSKKHKKRQEKMNMDIRKGRKEVKRNCKMRISAGEPTMEIENCKESFIMKLTEEIKGKVYQQFTFEGERDKQKGKHVCKRGSQKVLKIWEELEDDVQEIEDEEWHVRFRKYVV